MEFEDIKTVAAALLLIAVTLQIITPVAGYAIDETRTDYDDTVRLTNNTGTLEETLGLKDLSAQQSLGDAAQFNGKTSSLSGNADTPHDDTWTVTTFVQLDSSVTQSTARMRVVDLNGWVIIDYNTTNWRVIYYDDTSLNSYSTEIDAPSPTTWTYLTAQSNGTHLIVARNNTIKSTIPLTDGSATSANFSADTLHGKVDETRVYDDNLSSSERQQPLDQPTAPLKGANETARIYYDTFPGETTVDVFRTGQDLESTDVTFVDGFAGQTTTEGTDYRRDGATITALDGGTLDGAPAVFSTYTAVGVFGGIIGKLISIGGGALAISVVGVLVIVYQLVQQHFGEF